MANELNFHAKSDRLPPQNVEAEESVLGGILLDPEAIGRISDSLNPEAFYISTHKEIYRAALALNSQGKPTDLLAVRTWLADHSLLEKVGGSSKLAQLVERTVSAVNIDALAALVTDKYIRRKLIQAGNEIVQLGYQTAAELETILDDSEQKIFSLTQARPQQGLIPISDTLIHTFQDIEIHNQGAALPGLPCSFYDLDAMTGGFQRSDLIIVAGRPSMGKTSFAINIARNISEFHKLPVAIFSLEMSKEQLVQRMLATEAGIESNRLRAGRISQNEWENLGQAFGILTELPIFIDDTANMTVMQMRSQARRLQAEQGGKLGLILLDYLQLMEGGGDNRVQEISKITRSLKGLSRELNVPIIALSQLSRSVESRTNKRPMMSDLRESGCLTGDTLVTLADSGAEVPICELVGKSGFTVWAINETTMQIEEATVSQAFATGIKPVLRLKTNLGRSIRATANHKFLTIQGWKRLDELTVGDRIALPRQLASSTVQTMSNTELALLGHLIGDGCTLPRHAIQYTTREKDLAEIVSSLAVQVFGIEQINPRISRERDWYQVYLPASQHLAPGIRNPIAKWLENLGIFGLRSYEKFIPSQVFEQPQEAIFLFLRHLWSTDGSIKMVAGRSPRPLAYYASSSQKLARDVQSLLLRVEINARFKISPQIGKGRDQHQVIITGKLDLEKFVNLVGAVGSYKQNALQEIATYISTRTANTNRDVIAHHVWKMYAIPAMQVAGLTTRQMQTQLGMSYCGTGIYQQNISRERATRPTQVVNSAELLHLASSDVYWDRVQSIDPDGIEEVFDLTVPKLHNFVANNILVHNSIEQDADLVIMLYRDEYYNPDTPDRGIAEVIITKHRNGPTGIIKLLFDPQFTRFRNLASPNR